jgi:hypothetical protein
LLTPLPEPVPLNVIQTRGSVDFPHGCFYVVLYTTEADGIAIEQDIAGAPISIARLADRTHICESLLLAKAMNRSYVLQAEKLIVLREDARVVRVPRETALSDYGIALGATATL